MANNNCLPDIQLTRPKYEISINRVGIKGLLLPIFISQKAGGYQSSTAHIDCTINLDAHIRGISMSRIPRVIHKYIDVALSMDIVKEIANKVQIETESNDVYLSYTFPYFIEKIAPESGEPGLVHHIVSFEGVKSRDYYRFDLGVEVIATNLCPCSKAISKAGAHNQRVIIKIKCSQKEDNFIWLEDLINIAELSSSCEVFSILKREDERYVTEKAYNNPMFVEDVVRSCYDKLSKMTSIEKFKVTAEALESIHLHSAFAEIANYE